MTSKPTKPKMVAEFQPDENPEEALATANLALRPEANAAAVISEYSSTFGELNLKALSDSLSATIKQVWDGDMKTCEAMLFAQAQALQTIFMGLSRRAAAQNYMQHRETFLRLALKAQSQCRTTLETLATIKNPPVIFAKQANIAQGHQQVNNGLMPQDTTPFPRTEKNKIHSNELLEKKDEQWLDTRTESSTSTANSAMEALAKSHRSKD